MSRQECEAGQGSVQKIDYVVLISFATRVGGWTINVQKIECVVLFSFATNAIVATSFWNVVIFCDKQCRRVATLISGPTFCRDNSIECQMSY